MHLILAFKIFLNSDGSIDLTFQVSQACRELSVFKTMPPLRERSSFALDNFSFAVEVVKRDAFYSLILFTNDKYFRNYEIQFLLSSL